MLVMRKSADLYDPCPWVYPKPGRTWDPIISWTLVHLGSEPGTRTYPGPGNLVAGRRFTVEPRKQETLIGDLGLLIPDEAGCTVVATVATLNAAATVGMLTECLTSETGGAARAGN